MSHKEGKKTVRKKQKHARGHIQYLREWGACCLASTIEKITQVY